MLRPENQVCSDCPERQPRWASLIVPPPGAPPGTLHMGAFCCLECSGSHRRLGVHISFVRSINLDQCECVCSLALARNNRVFGILSESFNSYFTQSIYFVLQISPQGKKKKCWPWKMEATKRSMPYSKRTSMFQSPPTQHPARSVNDSSVTSTNDVNSTIPMPLQEFRKWKVKGRRKRW